MPGNKDIYIINGVTMMEDPSKFTDHDGSAQVSQIFNFHLDNSKKYQESTKIMPVGYSGQNIAYIYIAVDKIISL